LTFSRTSKLRGRWNEMKRLGSCLRDFCRDRTQARFANLALNFRSGDLDTSDQLIQIRQNLAVTISVREELHLQNVACDPSTREQRGESSQFLCR
jgi:hypothetical protein